jgi:hypothetical protein
MTDVTYTTIRSLRVPTALLAALDRDAGTCSRSQVVSEVLAARYPGNVPAEWRYHGRKARARGKTVLSRETAQCHEG